jgi:HD-GYP domain-containing protein (c-di-GMP phosphodiesterase class II)
MERNCCIEVLVRLIEAKEAEGPGHCHRVASLAASLAAHVGLDQGQVEDVHTTSMIHDLGKLTVPDEILFKPSRLTDDELAVVRRHPETGVRLISAFDELHFARSGVRSHHERWDGQGYPDRLQRDAIPLVSRIIAIADAFDAICSDRPYAARRSSRRAVAEVLRCAGSQFDPELAVSFADLWQSDRALQQWGEGNIKRIWIVSGQYEDLCYPLGRSGDGVPWRHPRAQECKETAHAREISPNCVNFGAEFERL